MNKEFMELMLRAPAVPEWFEPEMEAFKNLRRITVNPQGGGSDFPTEEWRKEYHQQKCFQWPSYYARKTLEAAFPGEPMTQPPIGDAKCPPPVVGERREFSWSGDRWVYQLVVSRP